MLITDPLKLKRFTTSHRVWQGIPGIAVTRGGRTFVSIYSGMTRETYGNFAVLLCSEDGKSFGEPIAAVKKEGKFRCFDPVLWLDPLGRLWFIWNVMPGEEVYASICEDPDGETLIWSDEFYVGRGVMMNKPLVLSTGEWLFPIAFWSFELYPELRRVAWREDDVPASYVYKTSDNGKNFIRLGGSDLRNRSFDEHMVMEMENGVLRMLVRLKKGIGESFSYDRGNHWSHGRETALGGPGSRFFLGKLPSGRVLLINHHRFQGRNNLTAFLSEDDGKTFPHTLLLDGRDNVSYPDVSLGEGGSIHVVYDRERGCFKSSLAEAYADAREILTARITEEDILGGRVCSEGSYLARVVSKLDRLAEEEGDPYVEELLEDRDFARLLIERGESDPVGRIFEKYPLNCSESGEVDTRHLDALITRFREGDDKDEELLTEMIRAIRGITKKSPKINPVVDRLKAYLEEHLAEDLSVTELAEKMKISVYYLSHIFKSVTGTGIIEYRNELRLTEAKRMLIGTTCSISEIAQRLGFCSGAYLSEVFSRSEGISPGEYRRLHQK